MKPVTHTFTAPVAATSERVFNLLSNPARMAEWLPGCHAVDTDAPVRKGTRLRVRFSRGETEFEITDYTPPTAFGWVERGRRLGAKTLFKLDFSGGTTAITMKDVWIPRGLRSWILGHIHHRRNATRMFDGIIQNLRNLLTR